MNSSLLLGLRRLPTLVLAAVAAAALVLISAAPAAAVEAYRYWTYWNAVDGQWAYAQVGPADTELADGAVEGWVFQTTAAAEPAIRPAALPDFDALCPDATTGADEIGVAVVVDYGLPGHAPGGDTTPAAPDLTCLSLPAGSTGWDALTAAADIRGQGGMVEGLNGYPTTESFGVVEISDAEATAAPEPRDVAVLGEVTTEADGAAAADPADTEDSGSTGILLTVAALLAALIVLAAVVVKGRKSQA